MKKIIFLLVLLTMLVTPARAFATGENWVALESDTNLTAPGQLIMFTLKGSLDTPINDAALTLRYDPTCFRVTSHHPGNLLPGAVIFARAQPGQFDLTYRFPNAQQGITGEGSLLTLQLEALKVCTSDVSIAPDSVLLGVVDPRGAAINLAGVEYRSLSVHFTPGSVTSAQTASKSVFPNTENIIPILYVVLPAMSIALYLLLRHRPRKMQYEVVSRSYPSGKTPALMHSGQFIPLPKQQRTLLGQHTEIIERDGDFYLANTGGLNGTKLNGSQLEPGDHRLRDGDEVQIGRGTPYRYIDPHEHDSPLS